MSQSVLKNDISLETFTHNCAYGSQQGNDYGCVGWLEKPICLMTFCLGQSAFGRMVFQKSDGMCITVGGTDLPEKLTWSFSEGERFTDIKIYTCNSKLIGVCITTTQKTCRAVVNGFDSMSSHMQTHNIDVGSGYCVGVFGNSAIWLESLGFAMLKPEAVDRLGLAGRLGSGGRAGARSGGRVEGRSGVSGNKGKK